MADPSIQTYCCHPAVNESDPSISIMMEFNSVSYNTVCLISSSIGILGALYQVCYVNIIICRCFLKVPFIYWHLGISDLR